MHLLHITLDEFRNYRHLSLDLPGGVTVLQGDNASGKTSLLEAVYMLATTRSPRASSDLELVNFAAPDDLGSPSFARITASVERARGPLAVEILVVREETPAEGGIVGTVQARKRIKVNGVARRALDLVGQATVVLFTPQDVDLVTGPPTLRRRYMDVTVSQMDHRYVRLLSGYMKVLAQRNALLRSLKERGGVGRDAGEELAYYDEELVRHGAYIVLRREVFATRLSERAEAVHHLLAGTEAGSDPGNTDTRRMLRERRPTAELGLNVAYRSDVAPDARKTLIPDLLAQIEADNALADLGHEEGVADSAALRGRIPHLERHIEQIGAEFKRQLEELRAQEIRRGVSVLGPHRDDLVFQLGDLPLSAYGSRGQQRTAVLALKLAEVDLMTAETGDTPILLLDDILSELDAHRRGYLLDAISNGDYQSLITTTDLAGYDPGFVERASVLEVRQGEVRPI